MEASASLCPVNGGISEVLVTTLDRYVWLYNQHLPRLALQHRTLVQVLKEWRK